MGTLPVSLTQNYIDNAIRFVLLKQGLPLGPADDLLSRIDRETGAGTRRKIIGQSLGYIVSLRKGDLCADKNLAYADHYLQTRTMVAFLGPLSVGPTAVIVVGYETKKVIWEFLGILDEMSSDNQCLSPVSPDSSSIHWGLRGAWDGQNDYIIDHPSALYREKGPKW